ncbi:MAG: Nif3-like dinuclear metal center hexameric protein [Bacteroidetes bacterium]|nr:Nif3-like dinuclear metal center hexameric protein [Bacteroidota bacterium]
MLLKEIIAELERFAPLSLQESYDNCGLLVGSPEMPVTGALLTLDCTEAVIDEAVRKGCNLVIAHHPVIFGGLKKLTGANYVERTVISAIRQQVAIYAAHTNLDNVHLGVNHKIANKLGLVNQQILSPKKGLLKKLVTFAPISHAEAVRQGLFNAGAGQIGNYSHCSFNLEGQGTFRGNEQSRPFIGEPGKVSHENETRIEVVFEAYKQGDVLAGLRQMHPYEEIAYDLYSLDNQYQLVGSGMLGELPEAMPEIDFLKRLKDVFGTGCVKHTALRNKPVKKVAFCGGSGSFLLKDAISCKSDFYVSSDFKYHEFFDAEHKIVVADVGHFETEQFTPEIFSEVLSNKFANFATYLSEIHTNPVHYF